MLGKFFQSICWEAISEVILALGNKIELKVKAITERVFWIKLDGNEKFIKVARYGSIEAKQKDWWVDTKFIRSTEEV